MSLTVTTQDRSGWAVLQVRGELDLMTSGQVRTATRAVVAEARRRLILDLTGVRFLDSSGVSVLLAARRLMRSCAGELRLVLSEEDAHVNRVFTALGVRRLFDIHPDLAAAVRGDDPFSQPA